MKIGEGKVREKSNLTCVCVRVCVRACSQENHKSRFQIKNKNN